MRSPLIGRSGDNRLFDGDDAVVHITEKAASTASLPVGGHADSIGPGGKRIGKVGEVNGMHGV